MAGQQDVRRIALSLPGAWEEAGRFAFNVENKGKQLAGDPDVFFTEPHYDGYPAVLVRLPVVTKAQLRKLISDAWECQAPKELVRDGADAKPGKASMRRGTGGAAKKRRT